MKKTCYYLWIPVLVLLTGFVLFSGCTSVNPPAPGPSATPAVTAPAKMPDLVGNWTGPSAGYMKTTRYEVIYDVLSMKVMEQKDRLFSGQISYLLNGTVVTKDVAGVIRRDGKTFETVESPSGFSDGVIISPDEIELIFRDDSNPSVIAIDSLKRSK